MVRQYNTDLYGTHDIRMKTRIKIMIDQESKDNLEELIDKVKGLNHITLMKKAHRYVRKWNIDRQRYLRVKRMIYDLRHAIHYPVTDMVALIFDVSIYEEGQFPIPNGVDFITIPMKKLEEV